MSQGILMHHCHVFPEQVKPEGTIIKLLEIMDACGVDQAVTFAPFSHQLRDTGLRANQWLAEEIAGHDRLIGFGTVDFDGEDLQRQAQDIYELGFRGIKIHPAAQKESVLSPKSMALYEAAQELGLLLTFHTGVHWHRINDYHLLHFDEIAWKFPDLRMSLEHLGGFHFFREAVAVIINNSRREEDKRVSHVYGGLTSVFHRVADRYWYFTVEQLKDIVWQVGAHQLIFGLDFPFKRENELRHSLGIIDQLGLNDEEKEMVLGGNLRRILGL